MAAVQQGMKSAGFRGTLPNPYRERSVANLHRNLAQIHGHRCAAQAQVSGALRQTGCVGQALRPVISALYDSAIRNDRLASLSHAANRHHCRER